MELDKKNLFTLNIYLQKYCYILLSENDFY